jgi:quercetin dioxygenase-like cupin family protein
MSIRSTTDPSDERHDEPSSMVIDPQDMQWKGHERFPGMLMKTLITSRENPYLSLNIVRIPPGVALAFHDHSHEVETVYMISGQGILTLEDRDVPFQAGQVVALPSGFKHCLKNTGDVEIQMITIFTPALV